MQDDKEITQNYLKQLKYKRSILMILVLNSCIAPFLYGYGMGVFNTAIDTIAEQLKWGKSEKSILKGVYTGLISIGAALGAIVSGKLVQVYGRRKIFISNDCLCLVACALMPWKNMYVLGIGRFLFGVVAGTASVICPIYIKEIVPTHVSGQYVSLNQFFCTFGILVAYAIGLPLPDPKDTDNP